MSRHGWRRLVMSGSTLGPTHYWLFISEFYFFILDRRICHMYAYTHTNDNDCIEEGDFE